jgi:hypothetical protein
MQPGRGADKRTSRRSDCWAPNHTCGALSGYSVPHTMTSERIRPSSGDCRENEAHAASVSRRAQEAQAGASPLAPGTAVTAMPRLVPKPAMRTRGLPDPAPWHASRLCASNERQNQSQICTHLLQAPLALLSHSTSNEKGHHEACWLCQPCQRARGRARCCAPARAHGRATSVGPACAHHSRLHASRKT